MSEPHEMRGECSARLTAVERTAEAGAVCIAAAEVTKQRVGHVEKEVQSSMQDIKDIKTELGNIRGGLYEIKIWILCAAVAGLMTVCGQMMYYGGKLYQVDSHEKRIDKLEVH
jgi:hypothetical protein